MIILADGMGVTRAGNIASEMAVTDLVLWADTASIPGMVWIFAEHSRNWKSKDLSPGGVMKQKEWVQL